MNGITLTSDVTVQLVQKTGGDHMVVHAARVSTAGGSCREDVEGDDYKLINYLMKHRHGTPFEHASLTFFVHAPVFVFREWHRHRVQSFNEESARYRPLAPVFWVPRRDRAMVPADGWKPGRPKFRTLDEAAHAAGDTWADDAHRWVVGSMRDVYELAYARYRDMLAGWNERCPVALEVARAVLPVGIYSSCWVTVNPRSLMAFLSLRTHDEGAKFVSYPQAEIEEAARAVEQVFAKGWPLTYAAFCGCGRVAP